MTNSFPTYALLGGDRVLLTGGDWHIVEGTEATVVGLEAPHRARIKHEKPGITLSTDAKWPCQLVERDGKRVKSVWKDSRDSLHIEFVDGSQAFTLRHGAWVSTIYDHAVMGCDTLLYEIGTETKTKEDKVTKTFKKGDRVTIAKSASSLYSVWGGGTGTVTDPYCGPETPYTVLVDRDGTGWGLLFKPADLTLIPTALTPETATDEQIDAALAKVKKTGHNGRGYCSKFDRAVEDAKKMPTYLNRLENVANHLGHPEIYVELVKELTPKPERKVKWPKGATVCEKVSHNSPKIRTLTADVYEGGNTFKFEEDPDDEGFVSKHERVEITVVN